MFASIYSAEPAAEIILDECDLLVLGFVVDDHQRRMNNVFAVETAPNVWLAFDVRRVQQLAEAIEDLPCEHDARLQALGDAIFSTFDSRESLAWALVGIADWLAPACSSPGRDAAPPIQKH